ncbi:MAG: SDR family oxidoreductase [Opitutales bacterium]|mgnify:FL=1|jgi:dTDP-4-dehydrorhamnose reductase|nr:SDR family oxidoreductase [Opitutales bacterium]MBT5813398.1 SDR family oxidoreductase [Opitutales bacterium]MBT6380986.1 SDR family oxidoreductase [Opitutales bacterium]MBT6770287.1 SDR family oxidoreductase [Opitutales bacterium]MBT7867007.1 SDR family oxidoreductase [Opitutales bacterium]
MKILLTGASGLLGSAFAKAAHRRKHEVLGLVGSYSENIEGLDQQKRIDLHDLATLEKLVLENFPDAIVNCAAYATPSDCETDPDKTAEINVSLPEKLALLSRHLFARYLHVSSDQVFDGKAAPYSISDDPNPPNKYGEQKSESEKRVLEMAEEFASVIRIPLLNGNSPRGTRSIHEQLFHAWSHGDRPHLFTDEYRQPCLTDNLAEAMVELCERKDQRGLLHWAGENRLSRFEIGQKILIHFGLPEDFIQESQRGDDPRFANRQADLSLELQPLAGLLKTRPQAFADQLDALVVPKPYRNWFNAI